jgi:hypothetical protein
MLNNWISLATEQPSRWPSGASLAGPALERYYGDLSAAVEPYAVLQLVRKIAHEALPLRNQVRAWTWIGFSTCVHVSPEP